MREHGPCGLADAQHTDPFRALVSAIISQQLSTRAAATIKARLDALAGGPLTPVGSPRRSTMKAAGRRAEPPEDRVSPGLVQSREQWQLALDHLDAMSDEEVVFALTSVKGIGRWTAEMFLMFRLHRPDVLPVGDLGIIKAVQRAYGLRKIPSPDRLTKLGEQWRPYRSVACWYLWASLDNKP